MNIPLMDKRVRSLEEMMADLIATVAQTSVEMAAFREELQEDRRNSREEMAVFKEEMQEDRRNSKEEMQADRRNFKEEMRAFREAMQEDRRNSKEEMAVFKEEMRQFRDSMERFKDRVDSSIARMDRDSVERKLEQLRFNRELGDIAHKQGRMAEDLVSPSICRILRETFHVPETYGCAANVRLKRIDPKNRGRIKEFDVVAECGDYVLVVETKSSPDSKDIPKLLKTIGVFREYWPEYKDRRVFGGLAMLYADKSLIRYASRKGILVLAVGDELMDVMNEPGFVPTEF